MSDGTIEVDTLIVGAGFAGLGLGILLKRRAAARGRHGSFLIVERADDVGGTWRDNVYPGVACDIPSHLYSFSFRTSGDWTHVYPSGLELQAYLRECAHDEGLAPHLRFGEAVVDARWNEADRRWVVTTTRATYRATALVSAVGRLSEPRLPAIEGLSGFPGRVLHTAAWDDRLELAGERVGLVGTGASAVQLLPHLQRASKQVTVFQRSAPYVVPRGDREYTARERAELADAGARDRLRERLFADAEAGFPARMREPVAITSLRERAAAHLRDQVADAGLRASLAPDYEIGCKRVLLSDDFYPAIASANVTLEASALDHVEGMTAVAASGERHDLDVLVFATGFNATRPPFADLVSGRDGIGLSEHWVAGMRAYASTLVHGFPNLFVLDGPNASLGHNSAVHMIETQLRYVLGALDHLAAKGLPLDVPQEVEDAYVAAIDDAAADSVWLSGCRNWYVDERSGRLTLLWPGTAQSFRDRVGTFDPSVFEVPVAG
ncbi:flavin-containing monooxygenase [Humibacter ginsenosidimutans]|uniref:NAD(P)/FAD-dependent oxidoreductase n=1 Tax=Humibacter ginsenosidimutans TaxID=2599293 RepID=A0A5B8M2U6_9MICO|nr:NAD(P)/FAD-dependent oxidoreductase [Humibacter ginsenosidimutans]QDZ14596.1 NAD(P)/FAD-dependent oxidoreductase [Humibacter ginsenosidimutans]